MLITYSFLNKFFIIRARQNMRNKKNVHNQILQNSSLLHYAKVTPIFTEANTEGFRRFYKQAKKCMK